MHSCASFLHHTGTKYMHSYLLCCVILCTRYPYSCIIRFNFSTADESRLFLAIIPSHKHDKIIPPYKSNLEEEGKMTTAEVEVLFLRHAESEHNVQLQNLFDALKSIIRFRLPTLAQLSSAIKLFEFDNDTELSLLGRRQLQDLKMNLRQRRFFEKYACDAFLCSPLKRATSTSKEVLMHLTNSEDSSLTSSTSKNAETLQCLAELSIFENMMPFKLRKQLVSFESKLEELVLSGSNVNRIIVTGHSYYFARLLGAKVAMRNCDVWRSTATIDTDISSSVRDGINNGNDGIKMGYRKVKWGEPELIFRSELSEMHPLEDFYNFLFNVNVEIEGQRAVSAVLAAANVSSSGGADSNGNDDEGNGDLDNNKPEEMICRICQATEEEAPQCGRLFRPCLCTGSVGRVHEQCLNTWRATSPDAFNRCNICGYVYEVKRSLLAAFLMHKGVIAAAVVGLLLISMFTLSVLVSYGWFFLHEWDCRREHPLFAEDKVWPCSSNSGEESILLPPSVSDLFFAPSPVSTLPWWQQSMARSLEHFHSVTQIPGFSWQSACIVRNHWTASGTGKAYLQDIVMLTYRRYIRLGYSNVVTALLQLMYNPAFYVHFLCTQPWAVQWLQVMWTGACALAALWASFFSIWRTFLVDMHAVHFWIAVVWLVNMGSSMLAQSPHTLARVMVSFALLKCAIDWFEYFSTRGRLMANRLGHSIAEVAED